MSKKILFLVLLALLLPFAAGAKAIGPSVSKYRDTELKWEDGAYGYHVMFKSLLENKEQDSNPQNPQAPRNRWTRCTRCRIQLWC